ncbi:MAG: cysteine synthase A [Thermoleophilia bacterium]|jgi:cysteine synthase A
MAQVFIDNSLTVGRTPLVQLNRVLDRVEARVLAKIEGRNPAYSIKDRVGASMIWEAERRGLIKPYTHLVEPTSGNTGIALAFVSAARGYRLTLVMPETMSIERRKVLAFLGADVVLTPANEGMRGAVARAEAMVDEDPERYYLPQQFDNPANPAIHERTTGPEIWDDTEGRAQVLVAGVGTGGTLSGISRYFKRVKGQPLYSVAVEPAGSPVITQTLAGEDLVPGPHKIQGIGAGFIPRNLDLSLVDRVEQVGDDEALEMARRLAREEGIMAGISSGAAAAAAIRLARSPEFAGMTIVVILPDAGERYLSTSLFEEQ